MKTDIRERAAVESFEICKEIEIAAPIDLAFQAMLDELGFTPGPADGAGHAWLRDSARAFEDPDIVRIIAYAPAAAA